MRSVHLSALTVLALGALAPSALAVQTFQFNNPFAGSGSSFANSVFAINTGGSSSIGTVNPTAVTLRSSNNGVLGPTSQAILSVATVGGSAGPSLFTTNTGGSVIFTDAISSIVLLQFDFAATTQYSTGFFGSGIGAGTTLTGISGSLITTPVDLTQSKFSFSFPATFTQAGNSDAVRATANFTSTIQAVPEPASMGVLAIGGVALLRRRRRA